MLTALQLFTTHTACCRTSMASKAHHAALVVEAVVKVVQAVLPEGQAGLHVTADEVRFMTILTIDSDGLIRTEQAVVTETEGSVTETELCAPA